MISEQGVVLVSWDYTHGKDKSIVIVGKKTPGMAVDIINYAQGKEAEDLITKLITKKEESNERM